MGVQILLVEDDKLLGHAVGTLMKENGYEVKLAGTKLEAEQILNYAMKHVENGDELRMAVHPHSPHVSLHNSKSALDRKSVV